MRTAWVCLISALLVGLTGNAQADMKEKLMPRYIKYTLECMKEEKIDNNLCKEMMKEGNDNTQDKYNQCKCVIACVAKKSKAMTADGEADLATFTALVDEFEIKEWSDEWKRVRPICEPEMKEKKNCVLGYDFFMCGFKNSEIFSSMVKKIIDAVVEKS